MRVIKWIGFLSLLINTSLAFSISPDRVQELHLGTPELGFDQEISVRSLQWLIPYFDIESLEIWVRESSDSNWLMNDNLTNDYLLNKGALEALPPEVRNQLAEGLDLRRSGLITESEMLTAINVLQLTGLKHYSAVSKESALKFRPSGLQTVSLPEPRSSQMNVASASLPASDWPVLLARWNRLPLFQRQQLIRFPLLTPDKIAGLIVRLPVPMKDPAALMAILKLKPEAPNWMKSLRWSLDGRSLSEASIEKGRSSQFEIAYLDKTADSVAIKDLVSRLQVEMKLSRQFSKIQDQMRIDTAFHWHISYPEIGGENDILAQSEFLARLQTYKFLMLISIMAGGAQNDLVLFNSTPYLEQHRHFPLDVQNIFDTPIAKDDSSLAELTSVDKGLLHLKDFNHVELREQLGGPIASLTDFESLFAIPLTSDFQTRVAERCERLLLEHPDILLRISRINPKILAHLGRVLGESRMLPVFTVALKKTISGGNEFKNILQTVLHFEINTSLANALIEVGKSGNMLLSEDILRALIAKADVRELFTQAFVDRPDIFDSSAVAILPLARVIMDFIRVAPERDGQYKKIYIRQLLELRLHTHFHSNLDLALWNRLRDFLKQMPAENETVYWRDLGVLMFDSRLQEKIELARGSGSYPQLSLENILMTLQAMISRRDGGRVGWFYSIWPQQGGASAFRWLAGQIPIRDPLFFTQIFSLLAKPDLSEKDLQTLIEILLATKDGGKPADESADELLTRIKKKNFDLVKKLEGIHLQTAKSKCEQIF